MTATPHAPDVRHVQTLTPPAEDAFLVRGGATLSGTVAISGAKNSALKLFAAALLAPGTSTLTNVPQISDTAAMADVLRHLGATVDFTRGSWADTVTITTPERLGAGTTPELAGRLRASLATFGPLMARMGRAWIAQPGGCNLGSRGVELHLQGMEALGAEVTVGAEHFEAVAPADGLRGADFQLEYASVGATENLVMAAVTARGTTQLRNVAREPEISDLIAFLNGLGARIEGAGTPELRIEGVDGLAPCSHAVVGDRIEAGTFAVAAAMTGGDVTLEGIDPEHLRRPLDRLEAAGVALRTGADHIRVLPTSRLVATDVATLPYPGFPTDMLAQFQALLSQAHGQSMLTENVYEGRFALVEQMRLMGADVQLQGHHVLLNGPRRLHGATVRATDLRAGAALVLAGLVADGETVVTDPFHIDRGYTDFMGKLRRLGADVSRVGDLHDGDA